MDDPGKVKKESKLSGLYVQKRKVTEKLEKLFKQESVIQKEIKVTQEKLAGIITGIEFLEERKTLITTHCIERFRERIGPLDATEEYIRTVLVTPQVKNMINTLGNGTYPVYDSIEVVVEDNKLITVLDTSKQKEYASKKRRDPRK